MANVTVNIQGNSGTANGGGNQQPPNNQSPNNQANPSQPQSQPRTSPVTPTVTPTSQTAQQTPRDNRVSSIPPSNVQPPDNRLLEDVRRAIIQQGAVFVAGSNTYRPIIQQTQESQSRLINEKIKEGFDGKREEAKNRVAEKYESIDNEIDEKKGRALEGVTDLNQKRAIEEFWEKKRNSEYRNAGTDFDTEIASLDQREEEERQKKNDDLTRVIEQLTEEIRRNGGGLNPNSFLSQLRQDRNIAVNERDTAEDEKTAMSAAQRVRDIDEKINSVTSGKKSSDGDTNSEIRTIQTLLGFNQLSRGIIDKNLGSTIMGGSQMAISALGLTGKSAGRAGKLAEIIAMMSEIVSMDATRYNQRAPLASLIRGNETIEEKNNKLPSQLDSYSPIKNGETDIYDLGLDEVEFSQSAYNRIRQRGSAKNGLNEAFFQEALERVLSLDEGSLGEAGKYDRYGTNVTDGITNLADRLSRTQNSGVTQGNYAKMPEFLRLQQGLMDNYLKTSAEPNYSIVNKDIEAFTRVKDYTVDSRTLGDIQSTQNAVLNPQTDRLKALLYSTVEQIHPEAAGSTRSIDLLLNDDKERGNIMKAYFKKIMGMYGGTETDIGYDAFKKILPEIGSPERRNNIVNSIAYGEAGEVLSKREKRKGEIGSKEVYSMEAENYTAKVSQGLSELKDEFSNKVGSLIESIDKTAKNVSKVYNGLMFLNNNVNSLKK